MVISSNNYDLPKIFFSMIFIILTFICCFLVVQPFILGFAWASIIVISTWSVLIKLQHFLWGKRFLAVIIMILLLLILYVLPIIILINTIINHSTSLVTWVNEANRFILPKFLWIKDIPIIGQKLYNIWHLLILSDKTFLIPKIQPYIVKTISYFVSQVANISNILLHCGLIILFSILLYMRGEQIAFTIRYFAMRINNKYGDVSVCLAIQAIRAVAFGVILTSIIQTILSGIGLVISGIPLSNILTIIIFILCIFQLGPLLVLIPSIIWLYINGNNMWGTILLIWSCIITMIDNILRPVLIYMGADLPILLIICGVLGGVIAFGIIGLFVGPVVLVISWHLLYNWIQAVPIKIITSDSKKII